jgi:hypothetical protein
MNNSDDPQAAPAQTSLPTRGIQAWVSLRLADGTVRLAAIPTSPKQARRVGQAREPELEAEL